MELRQHPLSASFPAMPEGDFAALSDDIAKRGLLEPVITLDGMVLDGWHRYAACKKLGRKCPTQPFTGDDPIGFVLARNLHRRHLTASQKAEAIVAATKWRENNGLNGTSAPGAGVSEAEMARRAEVSERTIRQAKAAHRAGLGDAVREGKVSAKQAAAVAALPPKQRERAVAAIERGESPPKKPAKPSPPPAEDERDARIAQLLEERDDLAETAQELNDRLLAFECTEPDEQQREILKLRKQVAKLEAEIDRLTRSRNDYQRKCNELIRQVKAAQRKAA